MDVGLLYKNDAIYTILVLDHATKLALDTNHYLVDSNLGLQYFEQIESTDSHAMTQTAFI